MRFISSIFFVTLACNLIILHANLTIARTSPVDCLFCDHLSYSSSELQFDGAPAPNPTKLETKGFMDNMQVFDVTKYGATPNGATESASAFMEAWKHACDHPGNATLYIPEGTFLLGPVSFKGPCYNNKSPRIELNGTLKALPSIKNFPSSYWIVFKDLYEVSVVGTSDRAMMDGQGAEDAWKQPSCDQKAAACAKLVTSLGLVNIRGGRVSGMSLCNSKGFHMGIHGSCDIDVYNMTIMAPGDSPNTDGVHVSYSCNINITTSTIGVGDDCVSIGPGTTNLSISNVQCGPGHGISVGSLGKYVKEKDVVGIDVSRCVLRGTQNGLRVKTWSGGSPSSAKDIKFHDIAMINVSNPIIIDQHYCPSSKYCNNITQLQGGSKVKISKVEFRNVNGTTATAEAVRILCSPAVPCSEIGLDNINLQYVGRRATNFTSSCQNIAGDISYSGVQSPRPCPQSSHRPSYN